MPVVRKALTIALTAAVLAVTAPLATAGSWDREPVTAADVLPPYEILTTMRIIGLAPIAEPVRRGYYYVLHAYDAYGVELRVVADAQFGDILSITPARAVTNGYTQPYVRGPRIIHIPRNVEHGNKAPAAKDEVPLPPQRRSDASSRGQLTPIYPTPRFGAKDDKSAKGDKAATPVAPVQND